MAVLSIGLGAMGAMASSPAVAATVLAESHFGAGAEGWLNGDFTLRDTTSAVTFDAAGFITVTDRFPYNAFIASAPFTGNKSAANRGTLSFDLGSDLNDGPGKTVPLVTLIGAGKLIFGGMISTPPATTGFSHYDIALTASQFFLGSPSDPTTGQPVSEADFAAILADLKQVAISGDFHSPEDFVRLDNVVLTSGAGIPEPSSWALMIGGFGLAGAALRRRRALAV